MKVLVTGGAGYVGSVGVHELVKADHNVVVVDNLSQGHRDAVREDAAFVKGNLLDAEFVDAVFDEHTPDAVMHFASKSLVGESMEKPFLYLGDNVRAGLNVMRAAANHG
ncbi:MAG: UDP-glucose 4-epimerase GalE, partial [Bacteroidetes bacterium QH_1_61_8]